MLLIIKGKDRVAGNVANAWTNQWPRCCTKGGISGRLVKAAGKETFYPCAFRCFFHLGQLNGRGNSSGFFYCEGGGRIPRSNGAVERQCDTKSLNRWVWLLMSKSWQRQTKCYDKTVATFSTFDWTLWLKSSMNSPSSWWISCPPPQKWCIPASLVERQTAKRWLQLTVTAR